MRELVYSKLNKNELEEGVINEQYADAIMSLGSTAQGIEALEYIMEKVGGQQVSGDVQTSNQLSADNLQTMMKDERYWNPTKRDNAFVKKVQDGFAQLYR